MELKIFEFLKSNTRYFFVAVVFLAAIFYSQLIPEVPKIKKNKFVSYQSEWKEEKADIGGKEKNKVYKNIFFSRSGEYYRLILKVRTTKDEKINIKLQNILGEEKEIGSFNLSEKDDWKNFELVFKTDDVYRDLILSKDSEISVSEEEQFEGAKIFISSVKLHPLEVKNEFEAKGLAPTMFGGVKFRKEFLAEKLGEKELPKNFIAGGNFEAAGDFLAYAGMNFKNEKNAKGEYLLEIYKLEEGGKLSERPVSSVSFFPEELPAFAKDGDAYVFNLLSRMEKGKKYFLGIKNKTGDAGKYDALEIKELTGEEIDDGGFFLLYIADFFRAENKAPLLSNAFVEDIGGQMIYYYESGKSVADLADIFEYKGKVTFDEAKKAVVGKSKKGSFFAYEINTLYSFEKMRIEAEQMGSQEEQIKMEYSYDNIYWKEISYVQEKDESQIFDYVVNDNTKNSDKIYLRISYNKEKDQPTKQFGLKSLKITASLEK